MKNFRKLCVVTVKTLLPICAASLLLVACGGNTDSNQPSTTTAPATSSAKTSTPSATLSPTSTTKKLSPSVPAPSAANDSATTKVDNVPAAPAKVEEGKPSVNNQPQGFYAPAPAEQKAPAPAPVKQAPVPAQVQQAPSGNNVYFKNCTEAKAAGYRNILKGQPGYGTHLDRDGDGIACEK